MAPRKVSKKRTRKPAAARALSETDVHYLVGFLYVVTRREDAIVLGDKVQDVTTGTARDVDIVVSGDQGILAVEVKDKGRPLDVGIVEGICMKYTDMPTIRRRAIVSSSGYTEPARRKAQAHDVKCLSFVRGSLPASTAGADMSGLKHMTHRAAAWSRAPSVFVGLASPAGVFEHQVPLDAKLRTLTESLGATRTLRDIVTAMPAKIDGDSGDVNVALRIEYPLEIEVAATYHRIAHVRAHGLVQVSTWQTPLKTTCYLANERGEAEASVVLFDYKDGLLGLATGQDGRVSIIKVPDELRRKRPLRHHINLGNSPRA